MSDVICELAPFQDDFITSPERIISIIAGKGAGKAQPLDEPVLTPDGFVPMGSLRVGDKIIGSDGKPHNVTGVFTQGVLDNYLVRMSDGTHTYCNSEHLWASTNGQVRTTEHIMGLPSGSYDIPVLHGDEKKSIESITLVGQCEMQCISVDAPDNLYVTRDFILTHNTWTGARFVAYQCVKQPNSQGLVMLNSRQQVLDIFEQDIRPLLDELKWPYALNAQALNLKILNSVVHLRSADPDAVKKVESIAYHWGWADEASYYPPETLKTFVSRIRKGDALVRVTSMPDEPDAFMYSFLENLGGRMYELGLKDNPDKEFAERYERFLRATYSGPQLERFLSGKRVSLSGMGIFAVESHHRVKDAVYDPDLDIHIVWDFNVEYRAVSAWQDNGIAPDGNRKTACVLSWRLSNATVYDDAEWLSAFLSNHRGNIILNGDASGESRTAQTTDSMWKTIRDVFYRNCKNVRYITPRSNPPVKDTIQCVNWALKQGLVSFNESERNVYMSLAACKADKYGEIDKSMDYQSNSTSRSHEADTARYHIFQTYKHVYPGNKGGFFIV